MWAQDLSLWWVLRLSCFCVDMWMADIGCEVGKLDGKGGVECRTVQKVRRYVL